MKILRILLDLDINKCGYALFINGQYKESGIIKTSKRAGVILEKPLKKTMIKTPERMKIIDKNMNIIGEWKKDPVVGKYRYWSIKKVSVDFNNDIDRAEYMTSKLIDIVSTRDYEEVNDIYVYIERSNFIFAGQRFVNNRKPEYIGMTKAYLWEGIEYRYDLPKLGTAKVHISNIFDINVSSVKAKLNTAYLTLLRKKDIIPEAEDLINRDSKYLSKQIVKMVLNKDLKDDEADAINIMFAINKLWYLENLK